jgi:dihydroxyacetone kinase phosphoprotein-dependent L subunit
MTIGLIFDCDGVLADTERYGHLPAFNQTFAEFGLPVRWTEAEYGEKLAIGGGKERMASLLTPEFVAAAQLSTDPEDQRLLLATWHRRKTEIYTAMVAAGELPARPGVRRLVDDARRAGWRLAVASTSAEPSVRAVLEHAVGADAAADFLVLAGDVVPYKKPAPDIYLLARERLDLPAGQLLVVEDSRNGLEAATAAGLSCLVTVNGYTQDEDFSEAALVVTSLGDPDGEHTTVLANRTVAELGSWVTLETLAALMPATQGGEALMPSASLPDVERVVRVMSETIVANETYFGELDSVVGDGDFGYSMARGFELVVEGWDDFDRTDIATFLKKVAVVITSRVGGTSGPIWGTAFLRAASGAAGADAVDGAQVVVMLRSAVEGMKARGQAELGDKTLLDALVPAIDAIEEQTAAGSSPAKTVAAAAIAAREAAETTRALQARRGRAAYSGERSIGTLDPGAVAVAVILEALAEGWPDET